MKIKDLPSDVIQLLDAIGEERISLDVAIELTKLPSSIDIKDFLDKIQQLTSQQKIDTIKKFNLSKSTDIDDLDTIKVDVVIYSNNFSLAPSFPYIIDKNNKHIKIPEILFEDIIKLIHDKTGNIEYIKTIYF